MNDLGEAYGARHAASLAACLPPDGAVARAEGDGWSPVERILALCELDLHVIWWQQTSAGHDGRSVPERLRSPSELAADAEEDARYTREYMDEVADALGIPVDRR